MIALISVNLGQEQPLPTGKGPEITGIFKRPASGPVRATSLGLEGDFVANAKHHGGPDQAVYVYTQADYGWWSTQLGQVLAPGTFGDNLTISELESSRCSIGDRLRVAEVLLEVTSPRIPCATLARRMGDAKFAERFRRAERPGLYCRVLVEGTLQAGDEVAYAPYSGERVGVVEVFRDYYAREKTPASIRRLLRAPLASRTRADLESQLARLLEGAA
jgi:MOSC domain-containing protein YiiM